MNTDRDKLVKEIFADALEKANAAERAAYLAQACGNDAQLRQRVEALLRAHEKAGGFLEEPAAALPGKTIVLSTPLTEKPGDHIGPYKLLQQIGEGGCGVVYMAEQEQPIRRRVALKVIKLGMDTKAVIARFEAERQALALMDHPNIAKVLDAGATNTGRPYFVMELVRGIKITDYCDQNNLSTEERLDLFVQICHAIQHAHQKGIIHRDIKPSNILVTVHDGKPLPKIIDFGIAKATSGQVLTDKTLFTAFEQFIGTPAYMSPEQAEMSTLDIDTRSDIYALGVLLYELLTGRTPFDQEELVAAGLSEMRRIIREREPVRPSTRISTLEAADQTTVARRRHAEPPQLIHVVRGDLDWIVMKCLEKNRTRRYATANELARDIECHSNHQPVSAAAPTLRYRTAKYVRRHRRVLATAGALVLMAVLGTTLSVWQARRAGEAEQERGHLQNVRWALETALPEIEQLLEKDDYSGAFKLVEQARPFVADNLRFQALSARVVGVISVETTPPGAQVFIRDYRDLNPEWKPIGKSPLNEIKVPQGFQRWKITMPEYECAEGTLLLLASSKPVELKVKLDKLGTIAPGMVRIQGQKFKANLGWLDSQTLPVLNLSDYLLDRYEVTNLRFKEFVEAGGYEKPEYWKHKFVKDGIELSWEAAMKMFVDQTGRPGPATWKNGEFPKGQEDYPVGGVSWYEAAAYAEFAGKRLPTVYHWSLAAGDRSYVDVGYIIPLSNFGGKGPAPVGTFQGMTSHGVYDMAGNVKEWCFNEAPEGYRVIAGGGWNEPTYMFGIADKYPPFFREATFGFRCMKLLTDDGVWEQAACSVQYRPPPVLGDQKPCSDEVFQAYKRLYDYNKSELQPTIESEENISLYTRREKVSFNAAYGNERMIAYLYIPRTGKPPFQTVVYFPGDDAWQLHSVTEYGSTDMFDSHTKTGRAFVFPVLQGTFERMTPPEQQGRITAVEKWIMRAKDFRRTIDYLETRPEEFDINKLAYEGLSRGGIWGGILPAVDTRIKVAVIISGGLYLDFPPEYSQVNFAPRIKIPILIQDGKYDSIFPVESNQKPFLKLFGTVEQDKQLRNYETGHAVWLKNEVRKDELDFLDKYLGPVK